MGARLTPAQRLVGRLRAMGLELPEGTELRRTYAGYWQRTQGAWSWFALGPSTGPALGGVGSQLPITALLREPRLCAVRAYGLAEDTHVEPWEPKRGGWELYLEEADMGEQPPEDEADAVRAELGECTAAGDHDVVDGLCIHCGAEFEDEPDPL